VATAGNPIANPKTTNLSVRILYSSSLACLMMRPSRHHCILHHGGMG
jgi:hypothetical protein